MNKGLLIGGAVILVLLLGVGGYAVMHKSAVSTPVAVNQTAQPTAAVSPVPTSAGPTSSLRTLLNYTGSETCDFSDTQSNSTGKVYVSAGKIRGDFTSQINGTAANFHMYTDRKNVYVWMSGQTIGFKTPFTAIAAPAPTGTSGQENVDLDRQLNYTCTPGEIDASYFTLPVGVTFSAVSAFGPSPAASASPAADKSAQCATCNQLPADAAAQCRTALGCSAY